MACQDPETVRPRIRDSQHSGDSREHHKLIIDLMKAGDLDWRAVDEWLRHNIEES
ncbi:MAG: hypothetical protein V3S32_09735 [Acidimicrobiia bacterium]